MKRVEVIVREQDAPLIRELAASLRRDDAYADRLRRVCATASENRGLLLSEALYDPAVADPKFDDVFADIERARHDPIMMKVRDVDL